MCFDIIYEDCFVKIGDWSLENYIGSYCGFVIIILVMENLLNMVVVCVLFDVGVMDVIEIV